MKTLLPFVVLAMALFATFLNRSKIAWKKPALSSLIGILATILVAAFLDFRFAPEGDRWPIALGLLGGVFVTVLGASIAGEAAALTGFGFGVFAASALGWVASPFQSAHSALGLATGSGLSLLFLGESGAATVVGAVTMAFTVYLGQLTETPDVAVTTPALVSILALAMGIAKDLVPVVKDKLILRLFSVAALMALGAFCIAKWWLYEKEATPVVLIAIGAALVVGWNLATVERPNTLRLAISAVIWVGVATAAFGLAHGYGVALALALAASFLIVVDVRCAITTLGPLLAIVLFRIMREAHPDATHAFDIGQHYAIIGLLFGATLPVVAIEWVRSQSGWKLGAGAWLWTLLIFMAPLIAALILAEKGVSGILIGLGLAPLLGAREGGLELRPLGVCAGLGVVTLLAQSWMSDPSGLTRADKTHWVIVSSIVAFVIAGILSALTMPAREVLKS